MRASRSASQPNRDEYRPRRRRGAAESKREREPAAPVIAQAHRPEAPGQNGSIEYRRRAGNPVAINEPDDDLVELEVLVTLPESDHKGTGPWRQQGTTESRMRSG